MKNLLVLLALVSFLATSCKKDLIEKYEKTKATNPVQKVSATKDIKVSENFEWSTTNEVELTINPTKSGLLLVQNEMGEVFYRAFVKAGAPFQAKFSLQNKNPKMYIYFNGAMEEVSIVPGLKYSSNLK